MKYLILWAATIILFPGTSKAESLDKNYHLIKKAGGLARLCSNRKDIEECNIGIGEWKPGLLEQAKSMAPFCYDQCEHDQYGFVKSSSTGKEYPQIVTKDFDGSSASRGVEFIIYPLAIQTYKYKGCVGCSLTKTYPIRVSAITPSGAKILLPRLARGTFYLPRAFRTYSLNRAIQGKDVVMRLDFVNDNEVRRISKKTISQYGVMLNQLKYSSLK